MLIRSQINVKDKTRKILEDNRGESLADRGYGDGFLDTTPDTKPMQ